MSLNLDDFNKTLELLNSTYVFSNSKVGNNIKEVLDWFLDGGEYEIRKEKLTTFYRINKGACCLQFAHKDEKESGWTTIFRRNSEGCEFGYYNFGMLKYLDSKKPLPEEYKL